MQGYARLAGGGRSAGISRGILWDHSPAGLRFSRVASTLRAVAPGGDDLTDGVVEGLGDVPLRVVGAHLGQVAVIADVVAGARLIDVGVDLGAAGVLFGDLKGLKD